MRILLLVRSFNSLTQRVLVELTERGHTVSVEFDVNDRVSGEAVDLFQPDLVLAPYLTRAIPEAIWRQRACIVLHPGPVGDRGPSALDWAILEGAAEWGVTALQAGAEMDAGDVWATADFPMRAARKGSLYRHEVTEAAVRVLLLAVERFASGTYRPVPQDRFRARPRMTQEARAIDWSSDDTATVLRKVRASDGAPGVLDVVCGEAFYLFDAHAEGRLSGVPGQVIARRHGAVCRGTVDGAVWIGCLRRKPGATGPTFKLPAAIALGSRIQDLPESRVATLPTRDESTWQDIWYEERGPVGWLHFDFTNGAMSSGQCERLRTAFLEARQRGVRVIVLMGGEDFWSNGIHLGAIEAAESPADESWRNINAMDDLAEAILTTQACVTIAALQGNAAAGGAFLALAADRIVARTGVVLNPHYKNMGNLYGSEYWTYLLPRRVGAEAARVVMQDRLPVGTAAARRLGLIDDSFGEDAAEFRRKVDAIAEDIARDPGFERLLREKVERRRRDEAIRPLRDYREEELDRMRLSFYGFDPSYHVARYNFVCKVPHSRTPLHLALHRRRAPRDA